MDMISVRREEGEPSGNNRRKRKREMKQRTRGPCHRQQMIVVRSQRVAVLNEKCFRRRKRN